MLLMFQLYWDLAPFHLWIVRSNSYSSTLLCLNFKAIYGIRKIKDIVLRRNDVW